MSRYTRRRRLPVPVLLTAALLLLAALLYLEQNWIQTETIEVYSPRLPTAFDGFRIVQISDLHGKSFGPDSAALLRAVEAARPDLIVLTGDMADERPGQMDVLPALACGLSALAPTYYVTGNHEWAAGLAGEVQSLLQENGVTPLPNRAVPLRRDGAELLLVGIDDPNGRADQISPLDLAASLRAEYGDPFLLLLAHRNNKYELYDAGRFDIVLAGHAHGGMIRLPFTDGLIGPFHEFLPKHTAGLYAFSHTQMVVSRGLSGGSWMQVRVFNRPHLPVIVLRSE